MKTDWKNAFARVWQISWPLIVASSFWNFQITIDRIYLGQYSTEALGAAIGAIGFFWAPMALVQQAAAYVTTFIAQYRGAGQPQRIGPCVWQSVYVSLIGGLLFLGLIPLTPMIFSWVGHSPEIQRLEVEYFQPLAFSALPTALVAAASGFFTGLGRSKIIMVINGVGLVLNVVLDYFLIFGHFGFPSLGITGAGIATALANLGAAAFGFLWIFRKEFDAEFSIRSSWKMDYELLGRFLKYGVPSGMQWALEGLAFTVFLAFVGRLPNGDAALAASGITVTIMMLAILPVLGVAQGVAALVGESLGDNNSDKAVQETWAGFGISMIYIVATGLSFILIPDLYLSFFRGAGDSPIWGEVAEMVPILLLFVAAFVIFDTINLIFSFTLKGAGDTQFVGFLALVLPWPIMIIPTWYVIDRDDGVYWAWAAASLYIIIQAFCFLARFFQGRWKEMRVIEN